ncbi:MAG: AMP-binding protein [Candidatus Zixiibacteriota bacterium]|nr:MAG: AMP-binding protein [candidate division Zixibacteria bacterium]
MLVDDFLTDSAQRMSDKVALVCDGAKLTYREIDELANKIANALIDAGVEKGDRVAVFLDNSVETVISVFGILKAGAVFLVTNRTTKADKLKFILNNCRAKGIISDRNAASPLSSIASDTPHLHFLVLKDGCPKDVRFDSKHCFSLSEFLDGSSSTPPPRKCISIDLASIIYTSGSTGYPKGVTLTHLNMVTAATSITQYLENIPSDIILNVLPLSFDYGLYQMLMAFKIGGRLVLEKSFTYPYKVINLMLQERVTGFPGVPTIFSILLQLEDIKKIDFKDLRYITNTGAALPVDHIRRIRDTFPKATLYSMYGLTECKRVSYLPPEELDRRPASVGKGMPNEEVFLVDDSGQRITTSDTVGELVVRGANVMVGYWENPEETAKCLKPGLYPWEKVLYTGDLFKMDEDGFLYFVGRKDDIIKSRGEKVSPKEVENVLHALSGVLHAAVIGVPDEVLGQAVKAFIVLKNGASLTEKAVLAHCRANLEDFMVPKYVEFRDQLEQTSSGKIKKTNLK